MSDHIVKTIEQFCEEIRKAEETLLPKKLLVNQLCTAANMQPVYTGLDNQSAGPIGGKITRNAFYGRPLSTCIREYLEMRTNYPVKEATLDEIFSALKEGGYNLAASGDKEDDQKRGVAIALGKNTQTFHRLPTGDYGLASWYPNIKEKKAKQEAAAPSEKPNGGEPAKETATVPEETKEVVE